MPSRPGRECAGGGRDLGDDVGLEEGGAAVLVADDCAIGELGREAHEALDGGVRHGVSSFCGCCPVDVSFVAGAGWFVFRWRFVSRRQHVVYTCRCARASWRPCFMAQGTFGVVW